MKTRVEIKAQAREMFRQQRGTSILIGLIVMAIGVVFGIFSVIPFIGPVISIVGSLFTAIISVSVYGAYSMVYKGEKASLDGLFANAFTNPGRKLGGMLWMGLFTFLWSLLLVIPGIIKSYSYLLTPYILAEYPEVSATEALNISKKMTKGYKFDLFVMHLSFLGWAMLSGLTFGILAVVFVAPYTSISQAGYYNEIKARAFESGIITPEELGAGVQTEQ